MSTLTVGTISEKVTDAGVAVDGVTLKDGTVTANRLSSDGTIVDLQKDGTTVGTIGVANTDQLTIGTSDGSEMGLRFDGDSEHILPANASGAKKDASADLGSATARWQNLYLSGGIYLGGTGSANLLDDYEEGTWTPSLNSYSGTPTFSNAEYVKAGNLVLASLTVLLDGTADASRFEVSSLPFTSVNTTASSQGGGVSYTDSTFSRNIYVLVTSNSTRFGLYEEGGSNFSYTEVGTNKEIRLFVIYKSQ